jgi:glycosyltransferase involved in cell wall biosynthesis
MKLLIISTANRLNTYAEFVSALNSLGVEALLVHDLKCCFLSDFRPLDIIPTPKLLKLVKQFNPDFVMIDSPYYIPYIVKLVNKPVLFHMGGAEQGLIRERYWDVAMYPSLFSRVYTLYQAKTISSSIKKVDLILPNCRWLEEQVNRYMPRYPTKVLYEGIDPKKWIPTHNITFDFKHPAVVGVFQYVIYPKVSGLLRFIKVIKKLPDVNFYFAGNGPYMELVKRNCPSNMFLIGSIPRSEVPRFIESGDVFVHPSGLDALPSSVKEASLLEKPIVSSNVGGIPEIVKDNQTGYLCDIRDTNQWVNKISYMLENPDTARRFGKNAREFVVATFDWKRIAEKFLRDLKDFA